MLFVAVARLVFGCFAVFDCFDCFCVVFDWIFGLGVVFCFEETLECLVEVEECLFYGTFKYILFLNLCGIIILSFKATNYSMNYVGDNSKFAEVPECGLKNLFVRYFSIFCIDNHVVNTLF